MSSKLIERQLSEMSRRIDILVQLAAATIVSVVEDPIEQMVLLSNGGLKHAQIAKLVGTTPHTVRQRLYEIRTGKRRARKNKPELTQVERQVQ